MNQVLVCNVVPSVDTDQRCMGLTQRRLRIFLNIQHFLVKQRNWEKRGLGKTSFGKHSHVITFQGIQLLLLEKF